MLYCATTGEAIIERGAAAAQTQKWTATVNIIYGGSLCGDVGLDKALSVLALCAHGRAMRWSCGAFRTPSPAPSSAAEGGGHARAPWEKQGAPPPPAPLQNPEGPGTPPPKRGDRPQEAKTPEDNATERTPRPARLALVV
ncbi:hypothetical protein NQL31_006367 [Lotmaria passim]